MTGCHNGNMGPDSRATDRRFYYLGRIIAVLELGARAQGEIRWTHLYYSYGLIPRAGLRDPLQKHKQSVLPDLERNGRAALYKETLDSLAQDLQELVGFDEPGRSFESWASQVLKDHGDQEDSALPDSSDPADALAYAQGYLDQRKALQPKRPTSRSNGDIEDYAWQYHLGRTITWNGASNDPRLSEGFQQGLKDKREITPNSCKEKDKANALRETPPGR